MDQEIQQLEQDIIAYERVIDDYEKAEFFVEFEHFKREFDNYTSHQLFAAVRHLLQ